MENSDQKDQDRQDTSSPSSPPAKKGFVYFRLNAACWLILVHEFLERFCFYGTGVLITLFLKNFLKFSADEATSIYHVYTAVSYLFTVFGAIISDNFLGRFKTVIIFGIVYFVGTVLMSLTTLSDNPAGPLVGLFVLAIGSGIIKPCVAAFGGDQTPLNDVEATDAFFSLFYLLINAGAGIAQYVTPRAKENHKCMERPCYALAFGIPSIAFLITYILFIAGKPLYRFVEGEENVFVRSIKLVFYALGRKLRRQRGDNRESFLDYGDDRYDKKFINDVKVVLSVLVLYLPFPIFWALFFQQGSRWSVQAAQMDGRLTDNYDILPEQMQMVNPILVVIIIPLFTVVIYPLLGKCNLLTRPPTRMVFGYFFAALSFVYAGLLQFEIDKTLVAPDLPSGYSNIRFLNVGPCDMTLKAADITEMTLKHGLISQEYKLKAPATLNLELKSNCFGASMSKSMPLKLGEKTKYTIGIAAIESSKDFAMTPVDQNRTVNRNGGKYRVIASPLMDKSSGGVIEFRKKSATSGTMMLNFSATTSDIPSGDYVSIGRGEYNVYYRDSNTSVKIEKFNVMPGKIGTLGVLKFNKNNVAKLVFVEEVESKLIMLPIQLPQYFLMTTGEVLFSVTAMSFAYSESPPSMKAIMQSVFLVTIFFGNIIVTIVAALPKFPSQAWEFILFAGLVVLASIIQAILAWRFIRSKSKLSQVSPVENVESETTPQNKRDVEDGNETTML